MGEGLWERSKSITVRGVSWMESPIAIGFLVIFLFPLGLWLVWKHPDWSRPRKVAWMGAWAGLMVIGLVIRGQERVSARRTFDEAGILWMAGDRTEAVAKYKSLLGGRTEYLAEVTRSIVYQRAIEFESDRGETEEARRLIDEARRSKIPLDQLSDRASALLSEVKPEKRGDPTSQPDEPAVDRVIAEAEAGQRSDPKPQEETPSSGETKSMMLERWGKEAKRREQIAERRATNRDNDSPTRKTAQEASNRRSIADVTSRSTQTVPDSEKLTEDFLPDTPGFLKTYIIEDYIPGRLMTKIWVEELQKAGGLIEATTVAKHFIDQHGNETSASGLDRNNGLKVTKHRRKTGGFIELQSDKMESMNWVSHMWRWTRILKIGAKKGEEWEQSFDGKLRDEFKVLEFGSFGGGANSRRSVIIERRRFGGDRGSDLMGIIQYKLVKGLGIVEVVTNQPIGGGDWETTMKIKLSTWRD